MRKNAKMVRIIEFSLSMIWGKTNFKKKRGEMREYEIGYYCKSVRKCEKNE